MKDKVDPVDISETDLMLLASLYNECLGKIDPHRYQLHFSKGYEQKTWYKELLNLYRTINKVNAKPRDYIQSQISEYKPSFKKGRRVPTIKMMTTEEGVQRYYSYMNRHGRIDSKVTVVKANLSEFAETSLRRLMANFRIVDEVDFFKDPYLLKQLPRNFVLEHPVYKQLCNMHFYEKQYGMAGTELIS